jgi:hypothetical protein
MPGSTPSGDSGSATWSSAFRRDELDARDQAGNSKTVNAIA